MRSLYVLKENRVVGQLHVSDTSPPEYTFVYEKVAQETDFVSLTMPPTRARCGVRASRCIRSSI
ncbi:MAG: hypothetical protein WDO56_28340 [Gammaproteobacteria bacterium]